MSEVVGAIVGPALLAAGLILSHHASAQQPQAAVAAQAAPVAFQNPIPADKLAFLNDYAGRTAAELKKDKRFRQLMKIAVPRTEFHYGRDMPLDEAIDTVLDGPPLPIDVRDGRYVMVASHGGPYLNGKGFMWFDMQAGIALGGFFFHPVNGEPTPTLAIFSRQLRIESLAMSQLPPEFAQDLGEWSAGARIPPVLTRYFITNSNKKIVLEHDEDFCAPVAGAPAPPSAICGQMNADAADVDLIAAYYLEQTNHATNGTAWMITGADQIAWLKLRDDACRTGPDPLRCRILMTRERTRFIVGRNLAPPPLRR